MPQLYHLNYNTITATLYWLDNTYNMSLVVNSRNKNKNGDEKLFISEYPQKNGLVNVYFDLRYYMEIRSINKSINGQSNSFRVDQSNYFQFMVALNNVAEWFVGKDQIFYRDKNDVIRISDPHMKSIIVLGPFNCKIEFAVGVRTGQMNGQQEPGIFIYINNADDPIFMDASKYMNFKYFMSQFNMYSAAMQLITYIGRSDVADTQPAQTNKSKKVSFFEAVGAKERKENGDG